MANELCFDDDVFWVVLFSSFRPSSCLFVGFLSVILRRSVYKKTKKERKQRGKRKNDNTKYEMRDEGGDQKVVIIVMINQYISFLMKM